MSIFHFSKKLSNKNIQYFKKCRELFFKKIRISLHGCSENPVAAGCCCSISPRCKGPPFKASNLDIKLDIREKDIKMDVYMRCLSATLYSFIESNCLCNLFNYSLFFFMIIVSSAAH